MNIKVDNYFLSKASPAKNKNSRKLIKEYQNIVQPDFIYTLFGPSYVDFDYHHITGFANGWVTHSTLSTFYNTYGLSFVKSLMSMAKYAYYAYYARKADSWIFETEVARHGFIRRLKVDGNNTYVIPNSSVDFGLDFKKSSMVYVNEVELHYNSSIVLCLAADYPHKNISTLIKSVSYLVNKVGFTDFKLVLTVEENAFYQYSKLISDNLIDDYVINVGVVNVGDLKKLYSVSSLSVLVSFIETFSAVYPESFFSGTPVVTSDLDFAKEVCGDAALFVDPCLHKEIALGIKKALTDDELRSALVEAGKDKAKSMVSSKEKYQMLESILRDKKLKGVC